MTTFTLDSGDQRTYAERVSDPGGYFGPTVAFNKNGAVDVTPANLETENADSTVETSAELPQSDEAIAHTLGVLATVAA
jgi:hypothetical protein